MFENISCIFYDFDGVMTDNHVYIDQNGTEMVVVNRSDGLAIKKIKEMGIPQIILSTEKNEVVLRRAEKLDIPCIHGINDKGIAIMEYAKKEKFDLQQSLFIGNDINDLPAFEIVGLRGAPADAEKEILEMANWISLRCGGQGVIRDLYREISNCYSNTGKE